MNEDETRAGLCAVFDSMVMAGWLTNYAYTTGKGFSFKWERLGAQKAILLKFIIKDKELDSANDILAFTKEAENDFHTAHGDFWVRCLDELEIRIEKDELFFFVHAVKGWCLIEELRRKRG
jgi:hypothetical protein